MLIKQFLAGALLGALIFVTSGCEAEAIQEAQGAQWSSVQPAQISPEHLQQLVAPIALYPDELVAEVLAASTYPTEVVEANRWLQQNSSLKGTQLANEVDKQSWDPSVKALTQFPSVLANMDKNLSWTSALGDAYFNDQEDVMNAIQALRKRAQDAGTLKTTTQQIVTTQGQTTIIEPANPKVVYLPTYDPWIVYGAPIAVYPGYIAGPWVTAPFISFGTGYPIWGFDWGWPAWGFNWGADSSFSTTISSFHGVTVLYTAVSDFVPAMVSTVMRVIFVVAPRAIQANHSIIEPIADSSHRTWRQATTRAHSTGLTTAA